MSKYFEINGFWKDDKSELGCQIVREYDDSFEALEDSIFFYGLSEQNIKDAIEDEGDDNLDFVITSYKDVTKDFLKTHQIVMVKTKLVWEGTVTVMGKDEEEAEELVKTNFNGLIGNVGDKTEDSFIDWNIPTHNTDTEAYINDEDKKADEIVKAKQILKDAGYPTDSLWNIIDVKTKFDCTDEEAYKVLDEALQNEASMEQNWYAIKFHGEEQKLTPVKK